MKPVIARSGATGCNARANRCHWTRIGQRNWFCRAKDDTWVARPSTDAATSTNPTNSTADYFFFLSDSQIFSRAINMHRTNMQAESLFFLFCLLKNNSKRNSSSQAHIIALLYCHQLQTMLPITSITVILSFGISHSHSRTRKQRSSRLISSTLAHHKPNVRPCENHINVQF